MSTLYELTSEYLQLMNMLYDEDEDLNCILDTMEGVDFELEMKADNYAIMIDSFQSDVDHLEKEIKRLQARKKTIQNRIAGLKWRLQNSMEATGKTKFKKWKARNRKECNCVEMVDVGVYNSCKHLCKYCYANYDEKGTGKNELGTGEFENSPVPNSFLYDIKLYDDLEQVSIQIQFKFSPLHFRQASCDRQSKTASFCTS
jgi:hypothetical protein